MVVGVQLTVFLNSHILLLLVFKLIFLLYTLSSELYELDDVILGEYICNDFLYATVLRILLLLLLL